MDGSGFARPGARTLLESMDLGDAPNLEALGAARAGLCAAVAAQGLTAFVSEDWSDLQELNRQHRNSWFDLFPRPRTAPSLWVGLQDGAGDVVSVQGAILLDCSSRSYGAQLEALTAFYADPSSEAPAEFWCFCASPEAREMRGRVAMMSSGWVRPDLRKGVLFHLVGRLNRLAALAMWQPDHLVALVEPVVSRLWTAGAVGERHLDRFPTVLLHQPGEGRLKLHVLRFQPDAVAADLQRRAS